MSMLSEFAEDFFLFLESGFIAVNQSDEDSAVKLFQAAMLVDPKNSLSKVGLGYMHLHKLEISKACSYFEEVLKEDPQNEMAKTFLGLALTMSPDKVTEGEKLLFQMEKSSDNLIRNLSTDALSFVDNFVKKEPTPLDLQEAKGKRSGSVS